MQIENAENATLISKHLNEIERNSVLNLKKDLGRFLKKYNEVLISLRHCICSKIIISGTISPLMIKKLNFCRKNCFGGLKIPLYL